VKFWDSSALVPLVVKEPSSAWARQLLRKDPSVITWTLSQVEVQSALARKNRDGSLTHAEYKDLKQRTRRLFAELTHVVALELVRDRALRLLDLHNLRAADTLQLAAALVVSQERPDTMPFVTLDDRLADAAEREGFPVESLL
jgi:predicted nucleic acid-binding protein